MKTFARREPVVEILEARTQGAGAPSPREERNTGRVRPGSLIEPLESRIAPAFTSGAINLSGLSGLDGTTFTGAGSDSAGTAVGSAGGVNGDGFDDFIIGLPGSNSFKGGARVIFGKGDAFDAEVALASISSSAGFELVGETVLDLAGFAVAAAGDVNGDGFGDILVGAPFASSNDGAAYLVLGRKEFPDQVPLKLFPTETTRGFQGGGDTLTGYSVAGAGDLNHDGFDDIILGSPGQLSGPGAAQIIYGAASLADIKNEGRNFVGEATGDQAGFSVAGAGDVNGDGFDDVIVGAYGAESKRGAAYVIYGQADKLTFANLSTITGSTGFKLRGVATGDYAGFSVSGAGDVNGDGLGDVIVGAYKVGSARGAAYVVFGTTSAVTSPFELNTLNGTNGFTLLGTFTGDKLGRSVSSAGDVNGDGIADLIVGTPGLTPVADTTGGATVLFGHLGTFAPFPLSNALTGLDGFVLKGVADEDAAGRAVSGAGDVNGDGFADLLVGAPSADPNSSNGAGEAYLVYGAPNGNFLTLAPAQFKNGGKTATWTDVDGDLVTVKVSKGTLTNNNFQLLTKDNPNSAHPRAQLLQLFLPAADFDGADVSVTAKLAGGGDGRVNVGFLNTANAQTGIGGDLGKVTIGGDLSLLLVGDDQPDIGLKSLTLGSMGLFGGLTRDGLGTPDFLSSGNVFGGIGALKIAGDFKDGLIVVKATSVADDNATIGSVFVGGNMGGEKLPAAIIADRIGPVTVRGDLRGTIQATQSMTSVSIGGSVIGGEFQGSGAIGVGILGNVKIGGSLIGGTGDESGLIVGGAIGKISIGGDMLGGTGTDSGSILAVAGPGANGNIAGVTVGGDVRVAKRPSGGDSTALSNAIASSGTLGPVVIKGDVVGTAETPFVIVGAGSQLPGGNPVGVVSLKIGGDLVHGFIVAGSQLGAISIGGDWIASTADAGLAAHANFSSVKTLGSYGNGDDVFIPAFTGVAKIKSVTIKGAARGTFETGDRFAIVSEQIGSVSVGGAKVALTKSAPGADPANDLAAIPVGPTPDFVVREVSRIATLPTDPLFTFPAAGPNPAQPAEVDLGALTGSDGFKVNGIAATDNAGFSVSTAGDVNGDGFDDFIVSANLAAENGSGRGAAYVVFGKASGFGAGFGSTVNLSALDGRTGFKLSGVDNNDIAGNSVSAAGDVNGDGFADVIVGAPLADLDHSANANDDRGAAYVVFGRSSFVTSPTLGFAINLGTLNGANGFKILGAAAGNKLGKSVSGAGDVNGDGFDDVIVGAQYNGANGAAYVIFGKTSFLGTPTFSVTAADGYNGFKLVGAASGDQAGAAVSAAGDVDGDGFADVIVGAPNANAGVGAAYVIYGTDSFDPSVNLGDSTFGSTLNVNSDGEETGAAVGAAGDINGDGFGDVIVGDPKFGATDNGASFVVFGHGGGLGATLDLTSLVGGDGFRITGANANAYAGRSVHGAGDVNGDGISDLIIGADHAEVTGEIPFDEFDTGRSYVVFGHTGGFEPGLQLLTTAGATALDGMNGFEIRGANTNDYSGSSVSAAGDINGDGFADVIVGSIYANGAVAGSGAAYVVFGGPSGEISDWNSNATGATYTDVDGDIVTIKISGTTAKFNIDADFKLLAKSATDQRAQLLELTLGHAFDGANVSITAKRAGGGDGKVNVGFLNADGDLGDVKIGGDLGRIAAGDGNADPGLKSLTLGSLGVFAGLTQDTGGELRSQIFGPVGPVKIAGDVREASIGVRSIGALETATLASLTIGGSLIGGERLGSGGISGFSLGPVKIGGDMVGSSGAYSGHLEANIITSLTVGGSLHGGSGERSGSAWAVTGSIGAVSIGGDQVGGSGDFSATLDGNSGIGKVSIKGDQLGGAGFSSALIFAADEGANIASVSIGGDARGGDAELSGGILAGGTVGPVSIKGDVTGTADFAYTIRGTGPLTGTTSVAVAGLKVGGDFDHALILAGYTLGNVPVNSHAQIGAISIGGDWLASSVSAGITSHLGATNAAGPLGNGDDDFIDLTAGPIASIASITIKGRAMGSLEAGDFFGIVAESIGKATIGGVKLDLTDNFDPAPFPIGPTPDFFIREILR